MDTMRAAIILEYNCSSRPVQTSVWLLPGALEDEEREALSEVPGIIHCIGPVEYETGWEVYRSIEKFIKALGIDVDLHDIPDD